MDARKIRDVLLGQIRLEEAIKANALDGSLGQALDIAEGNKDMDLGDPDEVMGLVLSDMADDIEKKQGSKKAGRWHMVATGRAMPLQLIYDKYLEDKGKSLATSTLAELRKAVEQFTDFAGKGVTIEEVDERKVGEFIVEFLPNQKSPKAPHGPGPATIRKKVTVLNSLWKWAMARGYLARSPLTPWTDQAPSKKEIEAAATHRRFYTPEEVQKLFKAAPTGKALGDIIRVALLTGVRLEEIASLQADQVVEDCEGYEVRTGKTKNAARYVPLVDMAQEVIKVRLEKAKFKGPLFPELPIRPSSEKRGGALSQQFTRLRRDTLGDHTDGELAQHSFRHTWRTAAGRARVDIRSIGNMGGWSLGNQSDLTYDHGLERDQYREDQEKVVQWLRAEGFLG